MTTDPVPTLLDVLLDSWDRNNAILVNLLRLIPEGGLDARATDDSPTVGMIFSHTHFVRLVFLEEDAPEHARALPADEWTVERDRDRMAAMLHDSARAVRDAVTGRLGSGRAMELHYDHPILMLQHLIWHEGYHHGQVKLALKRMGLPLADAAVGNATWRVWMDKHPARA